VPRQALKDAACAAATGGTVRVPTLLPRQIFQVAFVVPDLERAIRQYARELRLGGWVILENMVYAQFKYRAAAALASSGTTTYELIQQHDDLPSVYADTVQKTGYGFHHFAMLVPSIDEEMASYRERGFAVAMELRAGNGARACYIDTRSILPGMLELIEMSDAVMGFINLPYAAACDLGADGPVIHRIGL
jgi:catechol 2,3-dioxygenase-like lactoylglutathione lyase family enzyme